MSSLSSHNNSQLTEAARLTVAFTVLYSLTMVNILVTKRRQVCAKDDVINSKRQATTTTTADRNYDTTTTFDRYNSPQMHVAGGSFAGQLSRVVSRLFRTGLVSGGRAAIDPVLRRCGMDLPGATNALHGLDSQVRRRSGRQKYKVVAGHHARLSVSTIFGTICDSKSVLPLVYYYCYNVSSTTEE